ncbi:hypothetical protein W97_01341 [Coniosporium apollinis CBS 100218]|uniref:Uncharacterized protein n=1 Tax=Coniosporium apollinis (strain CBS 100218) TaxID=1168221 RepID=R7YJN4_CONA1|nr:uncharacterized protein W97_01341 [Coniosporium apollinis CBS 100218]EON62122.1 hypothetical protein W97_01341 [Coniosporium apollinis CBS 100218]
MFYDLNVPWAPNDPELQRTLAFLDELGYNVVALTHTISGKLPSDIKCPIPSPLPFPTPGKLRLLRRCTLALSDSNQNYRLSALSAAYDILAIRPTDEKTLQQACQTLDCDIISLDLTVRLGYHFKFKTLSQAIERGVRFEICYAPGVLASDNMARRNLISNATQLIRATRGRGLIISSEARRAVGCRGPWDVVNLAAVWGLGQERGKEAISKAARFVTVSAQLKRSSYRGVVDVIYGGEKPEVPKEEDKGKNYGSKKRKAGVGDGKEAPLSKRELKRREKKARMEASAPSCCNDSASTPGQATSTAP